MHLPGGIAARHLLVQDARPGGHPLDVAGPEHAGIAKAVAMRDLALEDVGDRLDAAMRAPRKALGIARRIIVAEIVEQQERVQLRGF